MAPPVMSKAEVDEITLVDIAGACNVPADRIEDIYSCTPIQLSMISETRSEIFQFVLSFGPEANMDGFCEALRQVVSLNAILRTRFAKCSLGIVQVVVDEDHVTERLSGNVEKYLGDGMAKLGNLGAPMFHSMFIDRVFVATIHHAIMDYWSINRFLKQDVPAVFYGQPPTKRPAFKEFVAQYINIDESAAKSFWAPRFRGCPAIFPRKNPGVCPVARPTESRMIYLKGIGDGISPALLPSFTEAAWALTSGIYADSDSVAYGLVLSGRSSALNGIESTLGPTLAEVPVQVNLQRNMTVERLIKDRAASLRQLQAPYTTQYGMEKIGSVSEAARIASECQTLFNIRPVMPRADRTDWGDVDVKVDRVMWLRGSFILQLICNIRDDGVLVETRSDPEALSKDDLHRILNQLEHTLQVLTEVPFQTRLGKLDLLNPHDRSDILRWNMALHETVEVSVHEVFTGKARAQPAAMAVEASDGNASYQKLDQMSDRLAHELRRRGVVPGQSVAFILEKSLCAIIVILSILKTGGVCVPIDKTHPDERKATMISISGAKSVFVSPTEHSESVNLAPDVFAVSAESIAELPEVTDAPDNNHIRPEDLAYIIFTDGNSAGVPKGVTIEHHSLVSSLILLAQQLGWDPGCRVLHSSDYASNISIYEIFGALLFGGCLCIPPEVSPDASRETHLSGFIESAKVNWALLGPGVLRNLSPSEVPSLQSVLCSGEPIVAETSKTWSENRRFFKAWGTSEASALSIVGQVTSTSDCPERIGTPVGCVAWIVNPQNIHELAPIGGVGELLIERQVVARGYLNDDANKSSTSFVSPPAWSSSAGRKGRTQFLRTGDLAKYNTDGSISFVGSRDNRVNLGGQILQLEEVEKVLASCPEVRDVVTLTKISGGRTQLIAVLCLADPQLPKGTVLQQLTDDNSKVVDKHIDAIGAYARSRLPSVKVPTIWFAVEELARTGLGKLDRAAVREWVKTVRH
ncbi:hypothetical protein DL769_003947 [Monosporascus sp. CRB-8-3]|nr:hypothetical protein DL769_003947 [Monosporascus sp. CRB-8-3]